MRKIDDKVEGKAELRILMATESTHRLKSAFYVMVKRFSNEFVSQNGDRTFSHPPKESESETPPFASVGDGQSKRGEPSPLTAEGTLQATLFMIELSARTMHVRSREARAVVGTMTILLAIDTIALKIALAVFAN